MIGVADVDSILNMLGVLINGFADLFEYFTYSLNDFLASIGIDVVLPSWIGGDLTPLSLMIGVALPMYLGYQFVSWILNLVT